MTGLVPGVARVRMLISHSFFFHSNGLLLSSFASFKRIDYIAYASSDCSSVTSVGSLPINLATRGVKMTVGGKRIGEAAL
jgi:hypothetical protein